MHTITDCPRCKDDFMYHTTEVNLARDITVVDEVGNNEIIEVYICQECDSKERYSDEFAIGFAEWCIKKRIDFFDDTEIGRTYTINGFVSRYKMNELLEMFKKEKGL